MIHSDDGMNSLYDKCQRLQVENEELREALKTCEAWIADSQNGEAGPGRAVYLQAHNTLNKYDTEDVCTNT